MLGAIFFERIPQPPAGPGRGTGRRRLLGRGPVRRAGGRRPDRPDRPDAGAGHRRRPVRRRHPAAGAGQPGLLRPTAGVGRPSGEVELRIVRRRTRLAQLDSHSRARRQPGAEGGTDPSRRGRLPPAAKSRSVPPQAGTVILRGIGRPACRATTSIASGAEPLRPGQIGHPDEAVGGGPSAISASRSATAATSTDWERIRRRERHRADGEGAGRGGHQGVELGGAQHRHGKPAALQRDLGRVLGPVVRIADVATPTMEM